MRYYSRLKQYKASNVMFNCETQQAYSYGWWCFYKDGVFNDTFYSQSTCGHQNKVRSLLMDLNIDVKLTLYKTNKPLHNIEEAIQDEIELTELELDQYKNKLNKLKKKDGKRGLSYSDAIESLINRINTLTNYEVV